jgi:hypothetical protein
LARWGFLGRWHQLSFPYGLFGGKNEKKAMGGLVPMAFQNYETAYRLIFDLEFLALSPIRAIKLR